MTIHRPDQADHPDRSYCHLGDRPWVLDPTRFTPVSDSQSRLRMILIGYADDVNQEILNLYHCGYEIQGWSPPQEMPGTGEVVRVYTKRSRRVSHA